MLITSLRFPNAPLTKASSLCIRTLHSRPQRPQATALHTSCAPPACGPALRPDRSRTLQYPTIIEGAVDTAAMKATMETEVLPVDPDKLGKTSFYSSGDLIDEFTIEYNDASQDTRNLRRAAHELAESDIPVAFPTETVYGLGADATRSSAVKAIYAAKGRPSDNPLIVHVHSLAQLRGLLSGSHEGKVLEKEEGSNGHGNGQTQENIDPIPSIYRPLIQKFWPGPLTIILPNPSTSHLAPEVTANLSTFGARMPRSILALALIRLAGCPLAAPSANASTRPSPTAAEHVKDDLDGRIRTIVDGGPCEVGVESTVVDGLSYPPAILRPGGIGIDEIRKCPGWEDVVVGYQDAHLEDAAKPRAPGMKYRHYSPTAKVVLVEHDAADGKSERRRREIAETYFRDLEEGLKIVGVIRTRNWSLGMGLPFIRKEKTWNGQEQLEDDQFRTKRFRQDPLLTNLQRSVIQHHVPRAEQLTISPEEARSTSLKVVWDINLGGETDGVARGLFSALRELDKKRVEAIFVEGIDDTKGDDIAAAVMNRLKKAAAVRL
ncbi:translation factor [Westerdykella ornata]|uniref:Threonylcarbamoyl-AMP synthase n=1 Tax=Westerdykella ornata TaxID=318751 RepID=A0A6A6JBH2_WESOR|nr:translation factor [Westerdykella ornata]KAF2273960.1 translation factor [Westerdykella ornata]